MGNRKKHSSHRYKRRLLYDGLWNPDCEVWGYQKCSPQRTEFDLANTEFDLVWGVGIGLSSAESLQPGERFIFRGSRPRGQPWLQMALCAIALSAAFL